MKRREILEASFLAAAAVASSAASAAASSLASVAGSVRAGVAARRRGALSSRSRARTPQLSTAQPQQVDYIVVGSGAGGGTVGARLAEAGYTVLVLEAGGNPQTPTYDVPAFHPFATDDESLQWNFYVHHYDDPAKERLDPNYEAAEKAFWYPRAGTLGGCTAHNALILVYPQRADWDQLADLTGDRSWRADNMRQYFERIEDCRHRGFERLLSRFGFNPSRHGYSGWLPTELARSDEALRDAKIRKLIAVSIESALKEFGLPGVSRLESLGDPNDSRVVTHDELGPRYMPLTTDHHRRFGTRERLLAVAKRWPDRLTIELDALATKVLLDGRNRATGVEYLKGARLYKAHTKPSDEPGERRQVLARREVILAGGAFNTPQLLMLSGVGPPDSLGKWGIDVRMPLENVGRNLQDRYEVAVVNRIPQPWDALVGATFTTDDDQYRQWKDERRGVYTTNGAVLSVMARSAPGQPSPDLLCYALLANFRGYRRGFSRDLPMNPNCFTWIVMKGHTNNVGGEVTLASADPRVPPAIHFKYFEDGTDASGDDLLAVARGIALTRRMSDGLKQSLGMTEELPGPGYETEEQLKMFVKTHAWGHHASCTCKIGPRDRGGVLGADFKVYGVDGLRVVDASVFPRIPGLFIASAIYMIGEKAADNIIADARARR